MTKKFAWLLLGLLFGATVVLAQTPPAPPAKAQTPAKEATVAKDIASGKYEGPAKAAGAADTQLTLELKSDAGKLSGRLVTPGGPIDVTDGTLTDNKVSLKLGAAGKDGTLAGQLLDGKLVGDWISGTQKRSVELKKVVPPADMPSLTGEWVALADVQGGFPFSLTLKVEGEKVTGSSSSQLGESTITNGSWKDGHLTFVLESANATIGMSATVVEGKLVGDFDYNGQAQGKWVATKKP
ncbi:MAG: hypothetical protein ABI596_03330 [Pyrinomonadaceae bacterium]